MVAFASARCCPCGAVQRKFPRHQHLSRATDRRARTSYHGLLTERHGQLPRITVPTMAARASTTDYLQTDKNIYLALPTAPVTCPMWMISVAPSPKACTPSSWRFSVSKRSFKNPSPPPSIWPFASCDNKDNEDGRA